MAIATHSFCWTGIITPDPEKAAQFYSRTLGWDVVAHSFPDGDSATMCVAGGTPLAHIRASEGEEPSQWLPYLRVDIVDTSAQKAEANGGKILVPPTDIAPGRFSVVASPSGAVFALFHESEEATSTNAPGDVGHVHWTELHSTDLDGDLAWLKSTFGYDTGEMPMPNGAYHLLKTGDVDRGGVMAAATEGAPSAWLTWIQVSDVDETCAKITKHGGTVVMEVTEMEGIGRMAIGTEPTGGMFGVITPPSS